MNPFYLCLVFMNLQQHGDAPKSGNTGNKSSEDYMNIVRMFKNP